MRVSVRKILQVGFLFACFVFLNCIYLAIVRPNQNSITLSNSKKADDPLHLQNGDRILYRAERGANLQENLGQAWPFARWFNSPVGSELTFDRDRRIFKHKPDNRKLLNGRDETLQKVWRPSSDPPTTSVHRQTEMDDIFISVKTTAKYHKERLGVILDTWWMLARDQTYFFTDADDADLQERTRGHVINTQCSSTHARGSLCCKMSVEYDTFITSGKRWFCHVDDDTYLNVPALLSLLRRYNHTDDWYLGKPSLNHPLEKRDIGNKRQRTLFWFATGGAGFCLSRAMALKMMPYTAGGKFQSVCEKIRLPDDCTIGFIVYYYVKKELTVVKPFHSHLEGLWSIRRAHIDKQLTFSYLRNNKARSQTRPNIISVSLFNDTEDPTRFKSIHCILYPNFKGCPNSS